MRLHETLFEILMMCVSEQFLNLLNWCRFYGSRRYLVRLGAGMDKG